MPLSIQIPYRGDQYLFQGISGAGQAIGQDVQDLAQRLKATKAYRQMAIDGMGMDPDQVDQMSLPQLQGHFQGIALQNAQQMHQAQMADIMSQIAEREGIAKWRAAQAEEPEAAGEFAKALQNIMGQGAAAAPAAGSPDFGPFGDQAPAAAGPGTPPLGGSPTAGAPAGQLTPAHILAAMGQMGATNPRLAGVMMGKLLPQLMGSADAAGTTPQSWTSPEGNPYVLMGKTLMPDRAPIDASTLTAPEGYEAVPAGGNRVQYLHTGRALPSTFHTTMDQVTSDIAGAQTTLAQPDSAFKSADEAKTMKGYAQRRMDNAQKRGQATVDRYHVTGYLPDEMRDAMYQEIGLQPKGAAAPPATTPNAAASAAAAGSPAGERVPVLKDGKRFTVPRSQLQDALKQGYTEAK